MVNAVGKGEGHTKEGAIALPTGNMYTLSGMVLIASF